MSNGTTTWNYTYDANGLRTKRTNGNYTYEYIYDGNGKLVFMQYHHYKMYFTYDPLTGAPHSVYYDDGYYEQYTMYYITNTRGDVLAMAKEDGTIVVSYDYDAWGNLIHYEDSTNWGTGDINPLRYRGYVYDRETGLYYLQSRYYDPEIGRFINADAYAATGQGLTGNNMFAYCGNNPISNVDSSGCFSLFACIVIAGCALIGGIIGACSDTNYVNEARSRNPKLISAPSRSNHLSQQAKSSRLSTTQQTSPPQNHSDDALSGDISDVGPRSVSLTQEEDEPISTGDRIINAVIGATAGVMVGGAIVFLGGAIACVAGYAAVLCPFLGMTGAQTAAWGLLAYNIFPIFVAPFLGSEMEVLEYPS